MLRPDDLRELLRAPAETLRLDFKQRLDWNDPRHKFEICRDIAAFANRSGGYLVLGVAEETAGGFRLAGMADDDPLPDPTQVNQVLRERFDPGISCEVAYVDVDDVRYGVIEVPEFTTYPHVCSREAGTPGVTILRPGSIYVRTDTFSTELAAPADLRRILESAVAKTGAAIARLVETREPRGPVAAAAPVEEEREIFGRHPTRRALGLTPLETVDPVRLSTLEDLVQEACVTLRGYAMLPRGFDIGALDGAFVLREQGRLVIELERPNYRGHMAMGVVSAGRDLRLNVWESLWEDTSPELEGAQVDITSMVRFAYAGLLFGWRLYLAAHVGLFRFEAGLTSPFGRTLHVDPTRFHGLVRAYRATTDRDIWVSRDLDTAALGTQGARADVVAQIIPELLDYWGYRPDATAFAAHFEAALDGLDDTPDPVAADAL